MLHVDECALFVTELAELNININCNRQSYWKQEALKQLDESYSTKAIHDQVGECYYLIQFIQIIKEYNVIEEDQYENFYDTYFNETVTILNCFNHFLRHHNREIAQFQIVYALCGGECDVQKCSKIQRHYRNQQQRSAIHKLSYIQQLFDKMHCHIFHSYDIGPRLTATEEKEINSVVFEDDNKDNKHENIVQNRKIIKLRRILNKKRLTSEKITNFKRYSANTFSTNLCQTTFNDDSKAIDQVGSLCNYSYSFPFNYLPKYKDSKETGHFRDYAYSDLYIHQKHSNLKEELLNNNISFIELQAWNDVVETAKILKKTATARKTHAETKTYKKHYQWRLDHPIHCGYIDGSSITVSHLIVLLIYCSFTEFQANFSATYRKSNNSDTLQDIIEQHSNYHHFAGYIREAILIFGTKYIDGDIKRMYHGIDKEFTFIQMTTWMYGPLSTTYDWDVAVQFSCLTGLVVELVPAMDLKYFQCEWVSSFSFEGELLFVGGFGRMNLLNVINSEFGWDFREYIQSLRIIDCMTHSRYFMNDPSDTHKIRKYDTLDVSLLQLSNISIWDKRLCIALIHHEINKNGYKKDQYLEYPHLHEYVDQLLHQFCVNKQTIYINWKIMNIDMLEKCNKSYGGYIGYLFLRSIFCNEEYEGINMYVFNALFPNLKIVVLYELSAIHSKFLNHIYNFMENNKVSKIYQFRLCILNEFGYSNIKEQIKCFKTKSKRLGFKLYESNKPSSKTKCLIIERPNIYDQI